MRWLALALALIWPFDLQAETYPALYEMTGVHETDMLDIRVAPDDRAQSIGILAPGLRNIEIVDLDETGEWGWINSGTASGWVAMRFLQRQLAPANTLLPRPLTCFGADPFWSIDIDSGPVAELNLLDQPSRRFLGLWTISSENSGDHFALLASSRGTNMNAIVRRAICNDGTEDRIYGFSMDLLLRSEGESVYYSGCCTITPGIR